MANRSYLYSCNIIPGPDAQQQGRKLIGISEYNYDIPIVFKLLLSGNPRTCPSSIWDSDSDIALIGDYEAGLANLERFLAQIPLAAAEPLISEALQFLRRPENRAPYFVLECGEIFAMIDAPLAQQNLQLLQSIQNLQPEIDAALQSLQPATSPTPAPTTARPGFWARLFGLQPARPSARPVQDPLQRIHALGLGHWSNILYFDFSGDESQDQ